MTAAPRGGWRRRRDAFHERHPKIAKLAQRLVDVVWAVLVGNLAVVVVRALDGSHAVQVVVFWATFAAMIASSEYARRAGRDARGAD